MDGQKKPTKLKQFPNVENKLQALTKKSVFERQKAEAEAKRLREEAETAAVYNDFVKSFDNEAEDDLRLNRPYGSSGPGGPPGPMSGSRRHFGNRGGPLPTSGPGSLGPAPQNLSRKRAYDALPNAPRRDNDRDRERERDRTGFRFEDYDSNTGPVAPVKAFTTSDDEDESAAAGGHSSEPAVPKPTLRLASLPPGTSPATIKAIMPTNITVEHVRIVQPAPSPNSADRKSISAIVTLAKETPAHDIDAAVNGLQNRYLGYGYYLSLHRGLSSAAISSTVAVASTASTTAMPFGAIQAVIPPAGPGIHTPGRGFAPPTSYAPNLPQIGRNGPLYYVPVRPPKELKELKLIHKTIEKLLTHGPDFEALLMSRPEVQKEEKWAWLWDARSVGGVWYRWRLWEILTGLKKGQGKGKYLPLFESGSAWKAPEKQVTFEYTTRLEDFVSDSEYNSSDEDDSGDEGRQQPDAQKPDDDKAATYLNPLEKAKLIHLLARLPTSTSKLRKGDVARVTAFAISHADRGADEVVSAILSNIEKPFAYTSANPEHSKIKERNANEGALDANEGDEKEDTSSASLIGIYLLSDILSSSSTSGVRHAWRYRSVFEAAIKRRQLFEYLGRMEKRMNWGRLRAEKWKRSVSNILSLWEGWCVFSQTSQEHFAHVFNNPPLTAAEQEKEDENALRQSKAKGKWKAVDETATVRDAGGFVPVVQQAAGAETEDLSGSAMNENLDGDPMDLDMEDLDGEPMDETFLAELDAMVMDEEFTEEIHGDDPEASEEQSALTTDPEPLPDTKTEVSPSQDAENSAEKEPMTAPTARGRRPKAEDMFADSDEDEK